MTPGDELRESIRRYEHLDNPAAALDGGDEINQHNYRESFEGP